MKKKTFKLKIINKNGTSTIQSVSADPSTTELFDIIFNLKQSKNVKDVKILEDDKIQNVINEGTPEQEKIKKIVDQYINLRKAIEDPNYPDTPHTTSAMKKVENILKQMNKKENYRISLLKMLPTQYQDFLK